MAPTCRVEVPCELTNTRGIANGVWPTASIWLQAAVDEQSLYWLIRSGDPSAAPVVATLRFLGPDLKK